MRQITLGRWTSIDPKRNRFRFYWVYLGEDLWGETALVKAWGRIGSHPRERFYWPRTDGELSSLLQRVILRRVQHGYRLNEERTRR